MRNCNERENVKSRKTPRKNPRKNSNAEKPSDDDVDDAWSESEKRILMVTF